MKLVHRIFLTHDRVGDPVRSVAFAVSQTADDSAFFRGCRCELLASQVSGRVCLVDANVVNPSLHDCYGVSNDIGLLDALRGTGPVRSYARRLTQGHESSLWLLTHGTPRNSGELLLTSEAVQARMRDLIAGIRLRHHGRPLAHGVSHRCGDRRTRRWHRADRGSVGDSAACRANMR